MPDINEMIKTGQFERMFAEIMDFFKSLAEEVQRALDGIKKVYGWQKEEEDA